MNKKSAGIYERRGFLYVTSSLRTEDGLWIQDGPCTKLDANTLPAEIGDAVLEALSRSGRIIPHPTEWTSVDQDNAILEAAGIKRWSTFRKHARYLSTSLLDEFTLTPTKNEGSEGFTHLPDDAIRLRGTADRNELGDAIQRALLRCG